MRSPTEIWSAGSLSALPRTFEALQRQQSIERVVHRFKDEILNAAIQNKESWLHMMPQREEIGHRPLLLLTDVADEVVAALKLHFDGSVRIEVVRNRRMPVRGGRQTFSAPELEPFGSDFIQAVWAGDV
jgi:hypothetical protein